MLSYTIRRVLLVVPTVLGAVTLLFALFFVLPGDPVDFIAGGGGERAVNPQVRANIEARYGLDDPIHVQYANYLEDLAQWELGESYISRRSINDTVEERAVASIRLGIWAIIIEIVVGISVGLWSAVRRYSWSDSAVTVGTAAASAIPVFVLGYLLQQWLAVFPFQHDWPEWLRFRTQGIGPDSWTFFFIPTGEQWRYLLLPAITLASVSTALAARMTRGSMLEVLGADYMRTARAKGLTERVVILRHGLRNALIPVVTLVGLDFGTVVGSAVLTETVFAWPGLGSEIAEAVSLRDAPMVLGLTIVIVLTYAVVNLLVDLSYAWLDPRIRLGQESES